MRCPVSWNAIGYSGTMKNLSFLSYIYNLLEYGFEKSRFA